MTLRIDYSSLSELGLNRTQVYSPPVYLHVETTGINAMTDEGYGIEAYNQIFGLRVTLRSRHRWKTIRVFTMSMSSMYTSQML